MTTSPRCSTSPTDAPRYARTKRCEIVTQAEGPCQHPVVALLDPPAGVEVCHKHARGHACKSLPEAPLHLSICPRCHFDDIRAVPDAGKDPEGARHCTRCDFLWPFTQWEPLTPLPRETLAGDHCEACGGLVDPRDSIRALSGLVEGSSCICPDRDGPGPITDATSEQVGPVTGKSNRLVFNVTPDTVRDLDRLKEKDPHSFNDTIASMRERILQAFGDLGRAMGMDDSLRRAHQYDDLLEEIDDQGQGLSTWECQFLEQMMQRVEEGWNLTEKQVAVLRRIHRQRVPGSTI